MRKSYSQEVRNGRSFKTPELKWASSYKFDCQRLARRLGDGQGTALHSSLLTIMRVQFKTDGGFVYLPNRSAPVTIDTDDLSAEEAKELERLLEAAGFFDLPQTSPPPVVRRTIFGTPSRRRALSTAARCT